VNHQFYTYTALRLAQTRAEEANRYHLAQLAADGYTPSPSLLRRSLARGLAAFSRGAVWVVRRLDSCVADDLGRALAPTE
jgi:hypothetical protein